MLETELAKELLPLLSSYDEYISIEQELIEGLDQGIHVYVHKRLVIMFTALLMSEKEELFDDQAQFIDSLHISNDDGVLEPYFIIINCLAEKVLPRMNEM